MKDAKKVKDLSLILTKIISETNGISIADTLEIASHSMLVKENAILHKDILNFTRLLAEFQQDQADIDTLLNHPVSKALFEFFKSFPLKYQEEHIHLTGSLSAEFIYPRLKKLLSGPNKEVYQKKIKEVYGDEGLPIESVEDVDNLIRLKHDEYFERYLKILLLPKLILTSKAAHKEAAYHMAQELFHKYNVGRVRLKFSLTRDSAKKEDAIPGLEKLKPEDVVLGLYEGFKKFQDEYPEFDFILSPSFRKETHFYDSKAYKTKKDFFIHQVDLLLNMIKKYPFLKEKLFNADTVGDEKDLYRKTHFEEMREGFRRLHYQGFQIRSHHGETWHTLKKGVQAVDNALNIWHIDTLEHGLSLGINPNFYFHMLFERVMELNNQGKKISPKSGDYKELKELDWGENGEIFKKLVDGKKLDQEEIRLFLKSKFHTAREVEHYQHDVLNRLIHKNVNVVALPSSNNRLTYFFPDFKDHPFSWWEKKGVGLGVGTDNYITLGTNFIKEMLILLYTDPYNLKITKLLMVVTGETRRPFLSHLLWTTRKKTESKIEKEVIEKTSNSK